MMSIADRCWNAQLSPLPTLHIVSYWDQIKESERSVLMRIFQHDVNSEDLCCLNLQCLWRCAERGPAYCSFSEAFQEFMGVPFRDINMARLLEKLLPFFRQALERQIARVCLGLEWVVRTQLLKAQEELFHEMAPISQTSLHLENLQTLLRSLKHPNAARDKILELLRVSSWLPPSLSDESQMVNFLQQAFRFNPLLAARGSPAMVNAVLTVLGSHHIPLVYLSDGTSRLSEKVESIFADLLAPTLVQDTQAEIAEQTRQLTAKCSRSPSQSQQRASELYDVVRKAEQQFLEVIRVTLQQHKRFALDPSQLPADMWDFNLNFAIPKDPTWSGSAGRHRVAACDFQDPAKTSELTSNAPPRKVAVHLTEVTLASLDSALYRESVYRYSDSLCLLFLHVISCNIFSGPFRTPTLYIVMVFAFHPQAKTWHW